MSKLNAKNEIPVLEIDGQILTQSVIEVSLVSIDRFDQTLLL